MDNPRRTAILDTAQHPIAVLYQPGPIADLIGDLEMLLDPAAPIVLLIAGGDADSARPADEQKTWITWVKSHQAQLVAGCRGVVSVEADAQVRPLKQKQAAGLQGALGLPVKVAGSLDEAQHLARELAQA